MKKIIIVLFVLFAIGFPILGEDTSPITIEGSRKNPTPLGTDIVVEVTEWGVPQSKLIVGVHGVLRGENAYKFIKTQNDYNDPPMEGYEYIIPMIFIANMEDLSGEDKPFEANQYTFELADSGYSHTFKMNMVAINEPHVLDAKLYEGSYTIGVVVHQAQIGEKCYLVLQNYT